jgi:hypothetical protein
MNSQASDCFTEIGIESTNDPLMRNVSSKSVILAPFNSTRTHISDIHSSVEDLVIEKDFVITFAARAREVDR